MPINKKKEITQFIQWGGVFTSHFTKEDIRMTNKYVKRCSFSLVMGNSNKTK